MIRNAVLKNFQFILNKYDKKVLKINLPLSCRFLQWQGVTVVNKLYWPINVFIALYITLQDKKKKRVIRKYVTTAQGLTSMEISYFWCLIFIPVILSSVSSDKILILKI